MSEDYDNVVGGALRLKGVPLPDKRKRKKKKKREQLEKAVELSLQKGELDTSGDGEVIIPDDPRTEAEKKFEEIQRQRESERLKKEAEKSHREKILELNQKLDSMSEHFDIPKVGPG
eukprot:TRINITY_DN4442_c0_g1_i1.p1 TRINITY_DN4442_c0_g1~~TRINITY_DN4442_c0_g1_i1.p1  ORF type:complete len:117 (+),score=37.03 TRINITY_DN4442_c0_g1_i1:191-541(+)